MRKYRGRAFTLIELLVVIAIIAILAAILFPVFAQAKRAAKGAVAISDAKQMAIGQLMYTTDYDDNFSPVVEFDSNWDVFPFSYLQQPYMKSWGVLLDPTGPVSIDQLAEDETDGTDFQIYGLWGMPPERSSTISTQAGDFTFGQQPGGQAMTNGQLWYYDGIGGVANVPNGNTGDGGGPDNFAAWGYKAGLNPSLTPSAVANPADQVMLAQSGSWDFMWEKVGYASFGNGNDTPDNFDMYWSSCDNTYQCQAVICAPVARQRDDGAAAGLLPYFTSGGDYNSSGVASQPLPTGLTCWAGTDGHVKATPWRQLMGTTIPIAGGQRAIKAFWPQGS
ncbi:MAG TPA: prepilin-type N-terminal cleavage/methylation domain-containing protein [Fimbriimonas sp.]|nr:prepilin-type N-terminal cleavage/methylation domain-containing protein [Fimbriimonas sp.]